MRTTLVSEVPPIAIIYILEGEVHPATPPTHTVAQAHILISIYIELEVE